MYLSRVIFNICEKMPAFLSTNSFTNPMAGFQERKKKFANYKRMKNGAAMTRPQPDDAVAVFRKYFKLGYDTRSKRESRTVPPLMGGGRGGGRRFPLFIFISLFDRVFFLFNRSHET